MTMTATALVNLVEDYFAAVDRKDVEGCLNFFTPDATFTIATFDVHNRGLEEIRGMFERLFARWKGIWHGNFRHVVQAPDRVASQFDVENRNLAGEVFRKCDANFFELRDGRFSAASRKSVASPRSSIHHRRAAPDRRSPAATAATAAAWQCGATMPVPAP